MRSGRWLWICVLVAAATATAAEAQKREITLTRRFGIGVRSMGMGGASVAQVDDGSALFLNPAGLARVRRIELAGGIKHQSYDLDTRYLGNTSEGSSVATNLGSLTGVYPVPTYRGSLVVAAGFERVFSSDMEMIYGGDGVVDDFPASERDEYSVTGGVTAWGFGTGFDISPSASVGVTVLIWDGHDDLINRYTYTCSSCTTDAVDSYRELGTDYSAVSANVGFQFRFGPHFSVGANIESPIRFTLRGNNVTYGDAGGTYWYEDKLRLPFSYTGGAALRVGGLSVASDIRYTDWRQIDYEGVLKNQGQFKYRSTTEFHLGAEYLLPFYPLRIRSGYYTEPLAHRGLGLDEDRSFYTIGAGFLMDDVLSIDIAIVRGNLKWTQAFDDVREIYREESFSRVFTSAAYRF